MDIINKTSKQLRRVYTAVLTAAILNFAGCATHRFVLTGTVRSPLMPADVQIFLEPLSTPYAEIAVLEASSRWSWSLTADAKTELVLKRLQRDAAALGANGILLQDMTSTSEAHGAGLSLGSDVTRDHASFGLLVAGPGSVKVGRGTAIFVAPH